MQSAAAHLHTRTAPALTALTVMAALVAGCSSNDTPEASSADPAAPELTTTNSPAAGGPDATYAGSWPQTLRLSLPTGETDRATAPATSGSASLSDMDGYTFDVAFSAQLSDAAADPTLAPPGETDVRYPASTTIEVTNITPSRQARLDVFQALHLHAAWPSNSTLCRHVGSPITMIAAGEPAVTGQDAPYCSLRVAGFNWAEGAARNGPAYVVDPGGAAGGAGASDLSLRVDESAAPEIVAALREGPKFWYLAQASGGIGALTGPCWNGSGTVLWQSTAALSCKGGDAIPVGGGADADRGTTADADTGAVAAALRAALPSGTAACDGVPTGPVAAGLAAHPDLPVEFTGSIDVGFGMFPDLPHLDCYADPVARVFLSVVDPKVTGNIEQVFVESIERFVDEGEVSEEASYADGRVFGYCFFPTGSQERSCGGVWYDDTLLIDARLLNATDPQDPMDWLADALPQLQTLGIQ